MKLLADENFPLKSIQYLQNKGYDISSIAKDAPGIHDDKVIAIASQEDRTILTFDRDYGELIFKHNHKLRKGVIYLRFDEYEPEEPGKIIEELLQNKEITFENTLTVIDRGGIRQRKY
jgi:predicted nuclease of predicted toxin-antitoxin system